MNKRIFTSASLVILLFTLAFFINNARIQNNNFFKINNNIEKIMLYNKEFDLYLKNSFTYNNFDIIENKIKSSKNEFEKLKTNQRLLATNNIVLQNSLNTLTKYMTEKYELISKVKSYRAILNKSFVLVQKIKKNGINNNLNNLYTVIMTLDKNPELNIENELTKLELYEKNYNTKNEQFFLKHSKTIFIYQTKLNIITAHLKKLPLEQELSNFHTIYNNYSQNITQKAYLAIIILFISLICSIMFYLFYDYKLALSKKELSRFRKTVEDSDNIVIITDENIKIKYVNGAFTKITGYTQEEVLGKNPKMFNSGNQSKEFYKELKETIYKGEKWSGRFINVTKSGELTYEKATITPVFDEDNKIIEFIAIKLDTTKETLAQQQLIKKEKLLLQQSKMAAMGEMLQNIAHQWRQPLSIISTSATGLLVKKELEIQTPIEEDIKTLNTINDSTQYLSETINAFSDFFNPTKEKKSFNIKDVYQKTLNIVLTKFKNANIEIVENINDLTITNLENELIQVLMNLLNNARDILEIKHDIKRYIFIDITSSKNNLIIKIKDNGGGIPEKIIDKVFEPYFTTKHKSQGIGIGLYMCQEIVTKHMHGKLTVSNQTFKYKDEECIGAEFKIVFPLS
ncbi:MAG: PAS domain S-box protein [Arcobacteraceae bacterium]